ncbi:hypothetical protein A2477_02520, partial [Candidatus Falkowbacteria bacterium RIFOXYC2_FULL_47_12]
PAIVYSKGEKGINLSVPALAFEKVFAAAGESSLVDLVFDDGTTKKVLIHEMQNDPLKNKVTHVDFYEVDLTKKVTTNVELEFVGEAPVVKNSGGIVIKHLDEIEIECLPGDLIKEFKIDISGLTDFSSVIHVKDLKISEKITILNEPDDVVVNVSEPRAVEEETPAPVEGTVEGAAAAAGEKKDGEAAAGEAKPAESKGGEKKTEKK